VRDLEYIGNAKKQKIQVPVSIFSLVATWFFVGRIPFAPGTMGTLAVYPLYFIVMNSAENIADARFAFLILAVCLLLLGVWAVSKFQRIIRIHDHSCIVIDEVVGMLLVLWLALESLVDMSFHLKDKFGNFLSPINIAFFSAFIVFRYFDIHKPFFIRTVERRMQTAFGVMFDDILAAFFSAGVLYIISGLVVRY
jgi:phosphatidylglycerophosphatase A